MKRSELRELIEGGESTTVEFKRKYSSDEKIGREIVAFINTKGGYLLIGVDDDKSIVGVASEKEEISLLEHLCEFCIEPSVVPTIEIVNIEWREVIVVKVEESNRKPHYYTGGYERGKPIMKKVFVRSGEKTIIASKEMEKVLALQNDASKPIRLSIGKHEQRLFQYLETHERITVKEFSQLANISLRRASQLVVRLVKVGVLLLHTENDRDYFTLADPTNSSGLNSQLYIS